jgi:hypothetical protein
MASPCAEDHIGYAENITFWTGGAAHVRFGSKADIALVNCDFRFTPQKRTLLSAITMSACSKSLLDHLVGADAANLPIVCAIYLMYWHARLDRAPDHVFCAAAVGPLF